MILTRLRPYSEEVATYVAGYIGKQMKEHQPTCLDCHDGMSCRDTLYSQYHYFTCLSRNGLFVPSPSLTSFVSTCFAILDITQCNIIRYSDICTRTAANAVLLEYTPDAEFTCPDHLEWGKKWAIKVVINVFFNNRRKHSSDGVRKDRVKAFKKLQRLHNK